GGSAPPSGFCFLPPSSHSISRGSETVFVPQKCPPGPSATGLTISAVSTKCDDDYAEGAKRRPRVASVVLRCGKAASVPSGESRSTGKSLRFGSGKKVWILLQPLLLSTDNLAH